MGYAFCQKLLVLPRGFFTPNDTHFLYVHGVTPSPLMGKLIHLTFRKNTTPFSPNNPADLPRIKVSAPATRRFPHGLRGQNECHLSTSVLGNISTSLLALSVYGNISNLSLECIPYF